MTTFIAKESSPRLPAPSNYTPYCERITAEQEAFVKQRRRKDRAMKRAAVGSVVFLAAVVLYVVAR